LRLTHVSSCIITHATWRDKDRTPRTATYQTRKSLFSRAYNTHCKRRPSLTWTQASFTNSRRYDTMAHDTTTTTTSSFPSHRRNTINLTVFSASKRASFAVFVISWFYLLSTNARPCSLITRYQSFSWCVCSTYYQLASPFLCWFQWYPFVEHICSALYNVLFSVDDFR